MHLTKTPAYFPLGFYPTGDLGPFTYYTSRRRRVVRFLRAPPTQPASIRQRRNRDAWTAIAAQWASLPPTTKAAWSILEHRGYLKVTAYNLYVYVYATGDFLCLRALAKSCSVPLTSLI